MALTDGLANNSLLIVISRFAMIAAAAALPLVGWLLQRSVATVDDIHNKIDVVHDKAVETNGNVKLIQQIQTIQAQLLADHETRVRLLENLLRQKQSPNQ